MKYLKKFNESLLIHNKESFVERFKIDPDDIEDYLTELSDQYDISIYPMSDHPRTRTLIVSFKEVNININSFAIVIRQKVYNNNSNEFNIHVNWDNEEIDEFFEPMIIMQRMETFISRIKDKYQHIKFKNYEFKEYTSGLKTIEYIFEKK